MTAEQATRAISDLQRRLREETKTNEKLRVERDRYKNTHLGLLDATWRDGVWTGVIGVVLAVVATGVVYYLFWRA